MRPVPCSEQTHSPPTEALSTLPSAKKVFLKRSSLSLLWNFHAGYFPLTSFWIVGSIEQPTYLQLIFTAAAHSFFNHLLSSLGAMDCRQILIENLGILFSILETELCFSVCLGDGIRDHGQKSTSSV